MFTARDNYEDPRSPAISESLPCVLSLIDGNFTFPRQYLWLRLHPYLLPPLPPPPAPLLPTVAQVEVQTIIITSGSLLFSSSSYALRSERCSLSSLKDLLGYMCLNPSSSMFLYPIQS